MSAELQLYRAELVNETIETEFAVISDDSTANVNMQLNISTIESYSGISDRKHLESNLWFILLDFLKLEFHAFE